VVDDGRAKCSLTRVASQRLLKGEHTAEMDVRYFISNSHLLAIFYVQLLYIIERGDTKNSEKTIYRQSIISIFYLITIVSGKCIAIESRMTGRAWLHLNL
jgi:hypothetical protein